MVCLSVSVLTQKGISNLPWLTPPLKSRRNVTYQWWWPKCVKVWYHTSSIVSKLTFRHYHLNLNPQLMTEQAEWIKETLVPPEQIFIDEPSLRPYVRQPRCWKRLRKDYRIFDKSMTFKPFSMSNDLTYVTLSGLIFDMYGKRSGNSFNVFLYQKIDFLISKNIFWYQKIDFLISEIDFLISENIFWYQKIFFDIKKWKYFLI